MGEHSERITEVVSLPVRAADAHKGDFGRVLIVGGSRGMIGAVAMAANSALRGGAGLVTFAAPASIQLAIAGLCPCATSIPLACNDAGELADKAIEQVDAAVENFEVIAVGPGFAVGDVQREIIWTLLGRNVSIVIDADGLNNLAGLENWAANRVCPLVLTPHPGEFSRLIRKGVRNIQSDREGVCTAAAREWASAADVDAPLVVALKGAGTVVSDGAKAYVNDTGNPGMATGGSGDVLTGVMAAFIAQRLSPFDAACLAVRSHGRAGDLAVEVLGETSLIATDLIDFLPEAIAAR